jgi:hypothetical protein
MGCCCHKQLKEENKFSIVNDIFILPTDIKLKTYDELAWEIEEREFRDIEGISRTDHPTFTSFTNNDICSVPHSISNPGFEHEI